MTDKQADNIALAIEVLIKAHIKTSLYEFVGDNDGYNRSSFLADETFDILKQILKDSGSVDVKKEDTITND